ncbi:hypothetical protein EVAR_27179_1 [Eumeta japonica]|uniref:Uncharacterized protein n=1 Tax=Eumeta variegata TaxID=151549 RepID=A0A4C1VZI5_EUMVA|nr:hypothetical protein EVAR_27179_1 [Eumeta japonica]
MIMTTIILKPHSRCPTPPTATCGRGRAAGTSSLLICQHGIASLAQLVLRNVVASCQGDRNCFDVLHGHEIDRGMRALFSFKPSNATIRRVPYIVKFKYVKQSRDGWNITFFKVLHSFYRGP